MTLAFFFIDVHCESETFNILKYVFFCHLLGTSAMSNHLKSKHPEEFKLINKKKNW